MRHAATLLLCSALLFLVQPLYGRSLLPLLGGTPAVFTTCLVAFQTLYLGGVLCAHGLTRLPPRAQGWLFPALLLLVGVAAPLTLPGDGPPPDADPTLWLLATLARGVALPCLLLSATTPLLSRWAAQGGHAGYPLYRASNLGSLAGLLLQPLLLEPLLTLQAQRAIFCGGFLLLAGLVALCAPPAVAPPERAEAAPSEPLRPAVAAGWVAWAALAASLLCGVTQHITTDVAALPLLWVLPLALYLLSFIVTFGPGAPARLARPLALVLPPLILLLLSLDLVSGLQAPLPPLALLLLHLCTFALCALRIHGLLAERRPPAQRLTAFYLFLALGGALGGALTALLAPRLFQSVLEYPLALLLCLFLPDPAPRRPGLRVLTFALPLLLLLVLAPVMPGLLRKMAQGGRGAVMDQALLALALAAPLFLIYLLLRSAGRLALIGALLAGVLVGGRGSSLLHQERGFFGVLRVREDPQRRLRLLYHGTTIHGAQATFAPARPLGYYHPSGPIGQLLSAPPRPLHQIAVLGLGVGTVAAYGRPGQRITFYELDPAVARVAQRSFRYLAESAASCQVVLGDARQQLRQDPAARAARYDLLIADAFSSDAIPLHLLTREALALYLERLAPQGLLLFNLSNRYFYLPPALGDLAAALGLHGRAQEIAGDAALLRERSLWVVLARREADLGALAADPRWRPLPAGRPERALRDERGSLLPALRPR